ncbi:MAG: hypothetical protein EP346_00055 [Bacteroidetes bacterium]|nr:MAG: hypothetical protein EP346_00055 [Bacteroidota bacterium]
MKRMLLFQFALSAQVIFGQSLPVSTEVEVWPLRPEIVSYSHGYWPTLGYDSLVINDIYPAVELIEHKYDSMNDRNQAVVLLSIENRSWKNVIVLFPYHWTYLNSTSPHELYFDEVDCEERRMISTFRHFNQEMNSVDIPVHIKRNEQIKLICVINEMERDSVFDQELDCFVHSNLSDWTFELNLEFWMFQGSVEFNKKVVLKPEDFHSTHFEFVIASSAPSCSSPSME